MQTENRNTNIHIKVALNSEFRRFSMDKSNFTLLEESIRTLYSLPISSILKVCFIDDEGDNVLISSDEEFLYAADLVRPIKLILTIVSPPFPVETSSPAETAQFGLCQTEPATFPGHPCRRGRGRGGHCQRVDKTRCEERKKWREEKLTLTKEERIQHKTVRISERIKHIEAFLLNDLPAHRERALTWKLEKLQSKLEYLQSVPTPIQTPTDSQPTSQTTEPEHLYGRRGCQGRRGGQGHKAFENQATEGCEKKWGRFERQQRPEGCAKAKQSGQFEHPQAQDGCGKKWGQFDDQVWQCRKNLRAARNAGNQSEIDQCFQALEEAKCQKWNAKREGRPECKRFFQEKHCKRECMKNLREARASGEPEKIQACETALTLAHEALQKAKVELKC